MTRLEDLQQARDILRASIPVQAARDASKLPGLSKELREVLREIEMIEGDQAGGATDEFDAFLGGGFDLSNVSRFPAASGS